MMTGSPSGIREGGVPSSGLAGMLGERQRRGRKKRSWRDGVWGCTGMDWGWDWVEKGLL